MRAKPACLPCCLRQIISTAGRLTRDETVQIELLRRGMRFLLESDPARTPAEMSTDLFRLTAEALGNEDPYGPEKERYNREAMGLYPQLRSLIEASPDRMQAAALLAVAGNLIDLGIMAPMAVSEAIERVIRRGFVRADLEDLRRDLGQARNLLYVGDNAGEIAYDRLLVEEIRREFPGIEAAFAVKSGPAMNDATRADAEAVGLPAVARIVETGGAYLGAPPPGTSNAFWAEFTRADVVIAKGHANYETLDERSHRALYFLLTVKCEIVGEAVGAAEGDSLLFRANRRTPASAPG